MNSTKRAFSSICVLLMISVNNGAQMNAPPGNRRSDSNQNRNANPGNSNQDQNKGADFVSSSEGPKRLSPTGSDSKNRIGLQEAVIILGTLSIIAVFGLKTYRLQQSKYHAFIIYKRQTNYASARAICTALRSEGLRVFIDVDDLRPGPFNQALLDSIASAPNIIVILGIGCLDFCLDGEDVFYQEISQAIRTNRNIIPIIMPGFPETKELPKEIQTLLTYHGVHYSHEFFNAMIEKIKGNFQS